MNGKFIIRGLSRENFSEHVLRFVSKYKMPYFDVVMAIVSDNHIEPEEIRNILSEDIKFQLEQEAHGTHMIKRTDKNTLI